MILQLDSPTKTTVRYQRDYKSNHTTILKDNKFKKKIHTNPENDLKKNVEIGSLKLEKQKKIHWQIQTRINQENGPKYRKK